MNVIFTCGGTGGHINPALAVANIWKEKYPDSNILFVGGIGTLIEAAVSASKNNNQPPNIPPYGNNDYYNTYQQQQYNMYNQPNQYYANNNNAPVNTKIKPQNTFILILQLADYLRFTPPHAKFSCRFFGK